MYSLTKKSIIPPHNINTMDIPMEEKDFIKAYKKYNGGALIQDAFPELPNDLREFIVSGITPIEWDNAFPPEEDDEENA